MKSRQAHIDFDRNYCEHYKPQPGHVSADYCELSMDAHARMKDARSKGEPNLSPCIGGHTCSDVHALCHRWQRRSLEHAEKRADSIAEMFRGMAVVGPVVAKWRTWTARNRVSKQEVIECPVCKGKLHLSQSSHNGHVRGQCETAECVNWIE